MIDIGPKPYTSQIIQPSGDRMTNMLLSKQYTDPARPPLVNSGYTFGKNNAEFYDSFPSDYFNDSLSVGERMINQDQELNELRNFFSYVPSVQQQVQAPVQRNDLTEFIYDVPQLEENLDESLSYLFDDMPIVPEGSLRQRLESVTGSTVSPSIDFNNCYELAKRLYPNSTPRVWKIQARRLFRENKCGKIGFGLGAGCDYCEY